MSIFFTLQLQKQISYSRNLYKDTGFLFRLRSSNHLTGASKNLKFKACDGHFDSA